MGFGGVCGIFRGVRAVDNASDRGDGGIWVSVDISERERWRSYPYMDLTLGQLTSRHFSRAVDGGKR